MAKLISHLTQLNIVSQRSRLPWRDWMRSTPDSRRKLRTPALLLKRRLRRQLSLKLVRNIWAPLTNPSLSSSPISVSIQISRVVRWVADVALDDRSGRMKAKADCIPCDWENSRRAIYWSLRRKLSEIVSWEVNSDVKPINKDVIYSVSLRSLKTPILVLLILSEKSFSSSSFPSSFPATARWLRTSKSLEKLLSHSSRECATNGVLTLWFPGCKSYYTSSFCLALTIIIAGPTRRVSCLVSRES